MHSSTLNTAKDGVIVKFDVRIQIRPAKKKGYLKAREYNHRTKQWRRWTLVKKWKS